MRLRVQVRGTRALVANFFASDRVLREGLRRDTDRFGHEQDALTGALAPYRSGRTLRLKQLQFGPDGLTYSIIWTAASYVAEGVPFYLPFIVWGTRTQPSNPFPQAAQQLVLPRYRRAVRDRVRAALRRRAAAAGGR